MGGRKRLLKKVPPPFPFVRFPPNIWQVIHNTGILTFSDYIMLCMTSRTLHYIVHKVVPWHELCMSGWLTQPFARIQLASTREREDIFKRLRTEIFNHWCCCCCTIYDMDPVPQSWSLTTRVYYPMCLGCFLEYRKTLLPIICTTLITNFSYTFDGCPPVPRYHIYTYQYWYLLRDRDTYYMTCFYTIIQNDSTIQMIEENVATIAKQLANMWTIECPTDFMSMPKKRRIRYVNKLIDKYIDKYIEMNTNEEEEEDVLILELNETEVEMDEDDCPMPRKRARLIIE